MDSKRKQISRLGVGRAVSQGGRTCYFGQNYVTLALVDISFCVPRIDVALYFLLYYCKRSKAKLCVTKWCVKTKYLPTSSSKKFKFTYLKQLSQAKLDEQVPRYCNYGVGTYSCFKKVVQSQKGLIKLHTNTNNYSLIRSLARS